MIRNDTRIIHTDGLEEGIRCAMCTNPMANNRGCDGGCDINESMYKRVLDVIKKNILEQEPCEDAVSRKAVLDTIGKVPDYYDGMVYEALFRAQRDVALLPSVNPQKIGHWIIEKWNNKEHYSCSSCQHVVDYEPCYPYCGEKMVNPQERRCGMIIEDEFPNIDELVYKKIINEVPIIDEYSNQEINKVLEEIKAEIKTKYESIPGVPWRFKEYDDGWVMALEWTLEIIDKHKRKISKLNMEPTKYEFQLKEGGIDERKTEDQKTQA